MKLGCVQPGESVATFGDALRHLSNRATYLYVDGKRYYGIDAIREYMAERTQGHMVLAADSSSTRVYGNTAVEAGTVTVHPEGGGEDVAHYLSVFRRGMTGWKLVSVALVPKAAAE